MILQSIFLFILGLVFGSFISALTWRYPRKISIKRGRSICPKCKNQIAWFDNIPLLSFVFLGGKCRNCKRPISWRYPAIELATALGFVASGYIAATLKGTLGVADLVLWLVLFLILFSIFIIDLEHRLIPDSFVFIGILLIVLFFLIFNSLLLSPGLFAGFFTAALLLIIHLTTKGRGMGLGDVKFAVLGGLIIGERLYLIWLLLAFLTGAAVGIILILGKKAGLKSQIAFGPFLILAIPLAYLYGEKILLWIHIG